MNKLNKRIVYIDFIKVFLTCMVVAHHAGQAYGNTGGTWLVSDNPKVDYLRPFFFLNASYMMGLYFFISGYFTYFSLKNKPIKKYLNDRLIRLGIPLIIFSVCIFGPLHYFISKTETNYITYFLDLHFNKPPLSVGHLWFVASLFVYSLIYLAGVKLLKINFRCSETFKSWFPALYLLLLIPINTWIRNIYPIDHWVTWIIPLEVAHLPQYISLFFLGVLFNKNNWLEQIKPITAYFYLCLGLLSWMLKDIIYNILPDILSESIIESLLCVGLSLGIIITSKMLVSKMNRYLTYLSENSYGIYLFHLFIVISLQIVLSKIQFNTNLKFLIVTIISIYMSAWLSSVLKKINILKKIL